MIGTVVQVALLVGAFVAACLWAEWPERMAALVFLATHALDRYYHWAIEGRVTYTHVDLGHLTIDIFMLAGLLAIALKADRQWTLWAAGAQVVALLSHPVRQITGGVAQLAYAVMIQAPGWLQVVLIFVGIAFAARRNRRRQAQRSAPRWRRSPATAPGRWPSG